MGLGKIKSKIDNLAKKYDLTNQSLWDMFFFENFLNRLSKSEYKDVFVFKGGFYLGTIVGIGQRTTLDIDLKYMGYNLTDDIVLNIFNTICEIKLDDEIIYKIIDIKVINNDKKDVGRTIRISASYYNIKKVFCIDIGVGDVITPYPLNFIYTSNINDLSFNILAYSKETILAEKIQTLIVKGFNNSRTKDLFDLYLLFKEGYDKDLLNGALINTFFTRNTIFNSEIYNNVENILSAPRMKEKFEDYVKKNNFTKGLQYEECKIAILEIIKNIKFTQKIDFNNNSVDFLCCDENYKDIKISLVDNKIDILDYGCVINKSYDIVIVRSNIRLEKINTNIQIDNKFNLNGDKLEYKEYYNRIKTELLDILDKYKNKKILLLVNREIISIIYCLYNGWVYSEYININVPKYTLIKLN